MFSSVELLDLLANKYLISSDYRLAKLLNVTPGLISKHRSKRFGLSDELALKVADLLDYDPAFVIACANYERANCAEQKEVYFRLAALAKLNPERPARRNVERRLSV
jgi:plasmid maintenance system antidote protein VapI